MRMHFRSSLCGQAPTKIPHGASFFARQLNFPPQFSHPTQFNKKRETKVSRFFPLTMMTNRGRGTPTVPFHHVSRIFVESARVPTSKTSEGKKKKKRKGGGLPSHESRMKAISAHATPFKMPFLLLLPLPPFSLTQKEMLLRFTQPFQQQFLQEAKKKKKRCYPLKSKVEEGGKNSDILKIKDRFSSF